jgi:oxygen-independent coproporphyrinogen-3 oxidase
VSTVQALYVHVPFCVKKCGYCDFFSLEEWDASGVEGFLEALEAELAALPRPLPLRTVFVGGGTPSVLDASQLRRLLGRVRDLADRWPVEELTVEMNPETVTADRLEALREVGVTRVSMGAQSFHAAHLARLDRVHTAERAREAARAIAAAGFTDRNIDLMFALPGETEEEYWADLDQALELEPTHVSSYALLYEPGTELYRDLAAGRVRPAREETELRMFLGGRERLAERGFDAYEISNHARPGRECRHNVNYWEAGEYYGVGPSAASHVAGVRRTNVRSLKGYVESFRSGRSPVAYRERLDPAARAGEVMMLGLRLAAGASLERVREVSGLEPEEHFGETLRRHLDAGLVERAGGRIRLTAAGLPVADDVMAAYV